METARTLRVNYKTLAAALQSGKLTPRLCDALERLLMIRELAALEDSSPKNPGQAEEDRALLSEQSPAR